MLLLMIPRVSGPEELFLISCPGDKGRSFELICPLREALEELVQPKKKIRFEAGLDWD